METDKSIEDTLEFYWVTSNDQTKLTLPEDETCQISSSFRKRIGDS